MKTYYIDIKKFKCLMIDEESVYSNIDYNSDGINFYEVFPKITDISILNELINGLFNIKYDLNLKRCDENYGELFSDLFIKYDELKEYIVYYFEYDEKKHNKLKVNEKLTKIKENFDNIVKKQKEKGKKNV